MAQVAPVNNVPVYQPEYNFCEKMQQVAEIVVQTAIRIIFIVSSILMAAATLPVTWHAVWLPITALGSSLLAGFFFPTVEPTLGLFFSNFAPLIRPFGQELKNLPPEAPRGLVNSSQNCAFNSLIQFLNSDPQIADWIRQPLAPEADLHATLGLILQAYDRAVQENRVVANDANSQALRLALNRITDLVDRSQYVQMDAAEPLTSILNALPDAQKIRFEEATHYDTSRFGPIANRPDAIGRKEASLVYLSLEMPEDDPAPNIERMLQRFCDHDLEAGNYADQLGIDNQNHRYPATHCKRTFIEAPSALRFQVKRFAYELGAKSWLTKLKLFLWPPMQGRAAKKVDPVETPEELTITLANGDRRTYRLASFVNHHGTSANSGHYTCARIVNGQKYLLDDNKVILADQQAWDEQLRQAYLLCYLPVPAA